MGENAAAIIGDEDVVFIVDGHGVVGREDRPLVRKRAGSAGACADHGLDRDEGAGDARLVGIGTFVKRRRKGVGNKGRAVELAAVAMPPQAFDVVKLAFIFDMGLDGSSKIDPAIGGLDLGYAAAEGFFSTSHEFGNKLGGWAKAVGPTRIANPATVRDTDIDGEDIAVLEGGEGGCSGAVNYTGVKAQAGV